MKTVDKLTITEDVIKSIQKIVPFYAFLYTETIDKMKSAFEGLLEYFLMQYQYILTAEALEIDLSNTTDFVKELDLSIAEIP